MSKVHEIAIPVSELNITPNDLSVHITGEKNALPPEIEESANQILRPLLKFNVLLGYSFYPAKLEDTRLYTDGEMLNVGPLVGEMLTGVEQIAVFACTVEKSLNQAMNNITDPVDIYLADVLGTIFIEKALKILQKRLNIFSDKNQIKNTTTFCPGNCKWEIDEQKKLLKLLPSSFLGISLNNCNMMSPVKSINGIVGFGMKVKYRKTSCKTCDSVNCHYRKNKK